MRRTKILATLGPASENLAVLTDMINNGLNAVRCNFSHGSIEDHTKRVALIREAAQKTGKTIGILGDLQGPKIRVARFKENAVTLVTGDTFTIDSALDKNAGDHQQVGTDYENLAKDLKANDILLLDDGNIALQVTQINGTRVITQVLDGGKLSNNKGINKQGGGLTAPALTAKDKEDIKTAAALKMDYVAISFPRDAKDMQEAKALLKAAGSNAGVVAKIERVEAVKNIDEIIQASDAVMVARGDLAVEIGAEHVPSVQKYIIQRCRELDTIVITATQMMESMVSNPVPTRAEVSDVANAVLDGTDTIMLSAESATGKHPARVVAMMDKVALAAETDPSTQISGHRIELRFNRMDEAIAMAAMYTANHINATAIVALTESGSTPLWMSRISSGLPIFALTRHTETMGRVTLWRGVYPIAFNPIDLDKEAVNQAAIETLKKTKRINSGDTIILTTGEHTGEHGGTNTMKITKVGETS